MACNCYFSRIPCLPWRKYHNCQITSESTICISNAFKRLTYSTKRNYPTRFFVNHTISATNDKSLLHSGNIYYFDHIAKRRNWSDSISAEVSFDETMVLEAIVCLLLSHRLRIPSDNRHFDVFKIWFQRELDEKPALHSLVGISGADVR